jgi:DNA-binding NarL/FixJ family response regulator
MPKVLVLEDEKMLLETILDLLVNDYHERSDNREKLDCVGFLKPEQALEWASWNPFDLMLTDVRMAGFADGIGTLTEIKKIRPSIYSIVLTGYVGDDAPARAMETGADHFLYKEILGTPKFFNAIEQVLQTRREHRTYQGILKGIVKKGRDLLASLTKQAKHTGPDLDGTRIDFYKSYYTAIQSKNLNVSAAVFIWDHLLRLETRCDQLENSDLKELQHLIYLYKKLKERVQQMVSRRETPNHAIRPAPCIGKTHFESFYYQIQSMALSLPAIVGAPLLFHHYASQNRFPQKSGNLFQGHTNKQDSLFELLFLADPSQYNQDPKKATMANHEKMNFRQLLDLIEGTSKT